MTVQSGIYHASDERPAPCFRLMTLDVMPGAAPTAVHSALSEVYDMLAGLSRGRVRDLEGQPADGMGASAEQFDGLQVLVGYGRRLFDSDHHAPALTSAPRPDYLSYLPRDGPFPSLRWEPGVDDAGEGDIAVQLTAPRQAAVNCAAVEIWKLVADHGLPLRPRASFDGFGRHDGRGWLEFHDGVSNLEASQRMAALEAPADPAWMAGGTYMAFLRLRLDLGLWRGLTRAQQEVIVGRDKLSGGGLVGVGRDAAGQASPVPAPTPGEAPTDRELADFIEPPQTADALLESSHIHRASQSRTSPFAPAGMRLFRQGYDFLEDVGPDGPRLGLNFVSFQRDLAILMHILHLPGWLGDVNFGGRPVAGPGEPPNLTLLSVVAGGLYSVPAAAQPYPGAELFVAGTVH